MLIFARIVLVIILITYIIATIGGVGAILSGSPGAGIVVTAVGALFCWLAYTNIVDAIKCAATTKPEAPPAW